MAINVPKDSEAIAGEWRAAKRWYDFFVNLVRGKQDASDNLTTVAASAASALAYVGRGVGNVAVSDDAVGVFQTVASGEIAFWYVGPRTTTNRLCIFAVQLVSATATITTVHLGADSLNGGVSVPVGGDGTDANANYYISSGGVLRVSNRLGGAATFDSLLFVLKPP